MPQQHGMGRFGQLVCYIQHISHFTVLVASVALLDVKLPKHTDAVVYMVDKMLVHFHVLINCVL